MPLLRDKPALRLLLVCMFPSLSGCWEGWRAGPRFRFDLACALRALCTRSRKMRDIFTRQQCGSALFVPHAIWDLVAARDSRQ